MSLTDWLLTCFISANYQKPDAESFTVKIPVDYETSKLAEEFNIDPMIPALNGGEDYELLFTVPLELFEKIKSIKGVKVIGHMDRHPVRQISGWMMADRKLSYLPRAGERIIN